MSKTVGREYRFCPVCRTVAGIEQLGKIPFCCGREMALMPENSGDGAAEKHTPVLEILPDGSYLVKVGSVPHPMTEEHRIMWIEIETPSGIRRCKLAPGDQPCAVFSGVEDQEDVIIREWCNIHGIWRK